MRGLRALFRGGKNALRVRGFARKELFRTLNSPIDELLVRTQVASEGVLQVDARSLYT